MKIEKFEDIMSWKEGKELTLLIYKFFETNNDFFFKDQIQRASVSIMNNIAEGFERKSNKEFIRFLYIAKGSCGEVRSMLYFALELDYINQSKFDELLKKCIGISSMIYGLIKSLYNSEIR